MPLDRPLGEGGCCGCGFGSSSTACAAWRICGGIAVFILCDAGPVGWGRGGRDWARSARARCRAGGTSAPPDASGSWRCGGGGRPRPRGVATSRAGVPPIGTCPFVLGAMGGVSCLTASIPELIPSPFLSFFLSFFPRPKTLLACCPARGSPGLPRCPPAPACVHRVVSTQHWRSGKVAIGMRILVHVLFFLGGLVVG
jgi:hypothetical protein